MVGERCSRVGCHAEVVAWIDGAAWCGSHALRVLAGNRPLPEEAVVADHARRLAERETPLVRFAAAK